jgi:hypothetical protein
MWRRNLVAHYIFDDPFRNVTLLKGFPEGAGVRRQDDI